MIFQSFSQINAIKENTIALRPLNFHENKFQRTGPSLYYSPESRMFISPPVFSSVVAAMVGETAVSHHGKEHGRRGIARERRCGCWSGEGKIEEAGPAMTGLYSLAMAAMVTVPANRSSTSGRAQGRARASGRGRE